MASLAQLGATAADIRRELKAYYASFQAPLAAVDLTDVPCRGRPDAKVTMVEFSDFECPGCSAARLLLEAEADLPGSQARLCFKYFPLQSHPHALAAAQAAEFARGAGRFWEMHDALFEHQGALQTADLKAHAASVGLDPDALERALADGRSVERIQRSKEEGRSLGVDSTPFLFLNGRPYTLPLDGPLLSRALEDHADWAGRQGWGTD